VVSNPFVVQFEAACFDTLSSQGADKRAGAAPEVENRTWQAPREL